ncbi:PR domain zinc finger protein 4 [Oryzias melastigma]|uniref:PR domain zinc finger protein 4 n=1 Tax=Oryzias melastigma TaxID=30732 RepID=A0A834FDR7_ORYME|nr:PR domain zinc finger protein 4 [Oryzias melastigma]
MDSSFECEYCKSRFSTKSNLTRHVKTHTTPPSFRCDSCEKTFTQKQHLQGHLKLHLYPVIPLYKPDEAQLSCTSLARQVVKESKTVDPVWMNKITAEEAAKESGGELWLTQLVITFGKYSGQTFKWLLENDIGWVVWLLAEFILKGETNEALKWQKKRLLELVKKFPSITVHLDRRVQEQLRGRISCQDGRGHVRTDSVELLDLPLPHLQQAPPTSVHPMASRPLALQVEREAGLLPLPPGNKGEE